jgi:hypothetical protein
MADDISRDTYEGAGPNGIDVRVYQQNSRSNPSVTTVLKARNDDKSHLYDWQDRNDGVGNNADHEHLFWYSRHIGTLGHWYALKNLDPSLEWSADEEQSERELFRQFADEVSGESPREVLYSVLRGDKDKAGGTVQSWGEFYDKYPPYKNGQYYQNALVDQAERDVQFFVDAQQRLWDKLGVDREAIISVEQFLFNDEWGYGGQVDLVYEDPRGNVVVADLKSSSGCYDKHQIQGAAYAKAIELCDDVDVDEVDRLEVHRTHPRTGQMVVHTHKDAPDQQGVHSTKYWSDSYDELWSQFANLLSHFDGWDPNEVTEDNDGAT